MARTNSKKSGGSASAANFGYEVQLWRMADALRASMAQGQSVQNAR